MTPATPRETLIFTVARLLDGTRHVAVGAASPIPAAGAMLLRAMRRRDGEEAPDLDPWLGEAQFLH